MTTTILIVAGLHLAHMPGGGLVLKVLPGLLVSTAALAEVETYIFPAVVAWGQGPIVSDGDGELYYPIVGWSELEGGK